MKKLLIIASLFLFSFTTNPKEKKYNFEFTENQINMLWNTLEFCRNSIQTSQSPANDVKNVTKMIDSLQQIIRVQYITQLKDTTKK